MKQIWPLDANVLDLRRNLTYPFTTIPPGTPLYTIADILDLGTSGPFFFDPARAILWGFYRGMNNKKLVPIDILKAFSGHIAPKDTFTPGEMLQRFDFKGKEQVLLELKSDKTVLFDNIMLNPQISSMSNLSNWTEESLSPMVIAFCNDKSRSCKLAPNIAYYNLSTKIPAMFAPPNTSQHLWIPVDSYGKLMLEDAMATIIYGLEDPLSFRRLGVLNKNPGMVFSKMPAGVSVSEMGMRICQPQQIFRSRAYYPVMWEKVWINFISAVYANMNVEQIKVGFLPIVPTMVGIRTEIADPSFPIPVAVEILKKFEDPKDILALCSVDRKFRNRICTSDSVQSLIREKYLPSIVKELSVPKSPTTLMLRNIPGFPMESSGRRWWKIPPVFFIEDILYPGVEKQALTGESLRRQLAESVEQQEEKDRRLKPFKEKRQLLQMSLSDTTAEQTKRTLIAQLDLLKIEEDKELAKIDLEDFKESRLQRPQEIQLKADEPMFRKLHISSYAVNKVIRNCNSFMAMVSLIYSMSQYGSLPITVQTSMTLPSGRKTKDYIARQTESLGKPKSAIELLNATPRSNPEITITDISMSGSWLHQIDIAPIFLNSEFHATLQKVKAFEIQRYRANEELNTVMRNVGSMGSIAGLVPAEETNKKVDELTETMFALMKNNLIIYRMDAVVAYILYSSIGGTPPTVTDKSDNSHTLVGRYTPLEYIDMYVATEGISQETMDILLNHVLLTPYLNPDVDFNKYYNVSSVNESTRTNSENPYSTIYLLFSSDIITVRFNLRKTTHINKIYYQAYMFLESFIRLMFLDENCDSAEWSVGF